MPIELSTPSDIPAILDLYPLAFPEEDLRPLVRVLLQGHWPHLSLVARDAEGLAGHGLFTLGATAGGTRAALLGPLLARPGRQRSGIGSALVRDGLERLRATGVAHVFVLGDPAYYGRFGFAPERSVTTPHPIPPDWADAWQSLDLRETRPAPGPLHLPEPWTAPALWTG